MREKLPDRLEAGRIDGRPEWGGYGIFEIYGPCGEHLRIVASAGDDDDIMAKHWEHVSVSTRRRVPNWQEMCFVKDLFWGPEECVVQFHPPRSEYVNNHPNVLHLWKHRDGFPMPPSILVGIKGIGELTAEQADAINRVLGRI